MDEFLTYETIEKAISTSRPYGFSSGVGVQRAFSNLCCFIFEVLNETLRVFSNLNFTVNPTGIISRFSRNQGSFPKPERLSYNWNYRIGNARNDTFAKF
jgi:hypothetical protein